MMRIALFLLTNLAVMVVFGLVLSLTGIQSSSMTGLLIMALLFGFGGAIIGRTRRKDDIDARFGSKSLGLTGEDEHLLGVVSVDPEGENGLRRIFPPLPD